MDPIIERLRSQLRGRLERIYLPLRPYDDIGSALGCLPPVWFLSPFIRRDALQT